MKKLEAWEVYDWDELSLEELRQIVMAMLKFSGAKAYHFKVVEREEYSSPRSSASYWVYARDVESHGYHVISRDVPPEEIDDLLVEKYMDEETDR